MTNDMMNLRALMEKSPDADLLREMIGYAAQRLMELEVGVPPASRKRSVGMLTPSIWRLTLLREPDIKKKPDIS
jgi:hypothetical protein